MKQSAEKIRAVADVLRSWGIEVVEQPGWATRGYKDRSMRTVKGALLHHTGGARSGALPSLGTLINGRPDLSPPLTNFALERGPAPRVHLVAAGLANHAGKGSWPGLTSGNYELWGIEAENTGTGDEPWASYRVYVLLGAAIDRVLGGAVLIGHKEWAPRRKPDPRGIDMNQYRSQVAAVENGGAIMAKADIEAAQGALNAWLPPDRQIASDGDWGPRSTAALRHLLDERIAPHVRALEGDVATADARIAELLRAHDAKAAEVEELRRRAEHGPVDPEEHAAAVAELDRLKGIVGDFARSIGAILGAGRTGVGE